MSMWTGLMAMSIIVAKSCMDVVGLEYNSKYQVLTDWQFTYVAIFMFSFAMIVDFGNWLKSRRMR